MRERTFRGELCVAIESGKTVGVFMHGNGVLDTAEEITRLTGQTTEDGPIKNGTVTFGWFVRNRYLPLKEADWREETAKVKKILIKADLKRVVCAEVALL